MLITHPGDGTHPDLDDEGKTFVGWCIRFWGHWPSPAACPHYLQA